MLPLMGEVYAGEDLATLATFDHLKSTFVPQP